MRTFTSRPRLGGLITSVTLPENVSLTATFLTEEDEPPLDLTAHVAELLLTGVLDALVTRAGLPGASGGGEVEEVDFARLTFVGPLVNGDEVPGATFVIHDGAGTEQSFSTLEALELLAVGTAAALAEGIKHEAATPETPDGTTASQ